MEIAKEQFDALAYIFEKSNGNELGQYENRIIAESGLKELPIPELVTAVFQNLRTDRAEDDTYRTSAYWALSKRFDKKLIPFFQTCLRKELSVAGVPAVFQLLIALDNLTEPVFGADRHGSYGGHDVVLNVRDAETYLDKYCP